MTGADNVNNDPSIRPVQPNAPAKRPDAPGKTPDGTSFGDVLRQKVAEQLPTQREADRVHEEAPGESIRWSAHATARLQQRGIQVGPEQQMRVESAVDRAAAKGARESLVVMDDVAMVVSVTNRTVITAIGQDQARDNVFTNIDSAVFA